eukprot:2862955-Ditylum_brightwellii.AAC.1
MSRQLNLCCLIIMPNIICMLDNLDFAAASYQLMQQGLTIRLFHVWFTIDHDTLIHNLQSWKMLMCGSTSASIHNMKDVMGTFTVLVSVDWIDASGQLQAFTAVSRPHFLAPLSRPHLLTYT